MEFTPVEISVAVGLVCRCRDEKDRASPSGIVWQARDCRERDRGRDGERGRQR